MKVYIGGIDKASFAETDGVSYNIYFSGCSIRCPECHNKEMWDLHSGELMETDDIIADVKSNLELIDNVCILGGEPTDQISALRELLKGFSYIGVPVWLYTGREYEDIRHFNIASYCDVIKCGPYDSKYKGRGDSGLASSNQYFIRKTEE